MLPLDFAGEKHKEQSVPNPTIAQRTKEFRDKVAEEFITVDDVSRVLVYADPIPENIRSREFSVWLTKHLRSFLSQGILLGMAQPERFFPESLHSTPCPTEPAK